MNGKANMFPNHLGKYQKVGYITRIQTLKVPKDRIELPSEVLQTSALTIVLLGVMSPRQESNLCRQFTKLLLNHSTTRALCRR